MTKNEIVKKGLESLREHNRSDDNQIIRKLNHSVLMEYAENLEKYDNDLEAIDPDDDTLWLNFIEPLHQLGSKLTRMEDLQKNTHRKAVIKTIIWIVG